MRILYLIKESLKGWSTHRQVTLPTLLTIGLCTFILTGAFLVLQGVWTYQVSSESRWKVEVFLQSGTENDYKLWGEDLLKDPAISEASFVSPQMAWSRFQRDFGPEMLQDLEVNPLPASWEFIVDQEFQSSYRVSSLLARLKSKPWVEEISSASQSLNMLESWGMRLKLGSSVIVLFLSFLIWLIIKNSVRMSLYSRSVLVENMKYLGASEFHIGFPFIFEAIIQTFIAVLVSFLVWQGLFDFVSINLPMMGEVFVMSWELFPYVWAVWTFMAVLTAWKTVQHSLREHWEN